MHALVIPPALYEGTGTIHIYSTSVGVFTMLDAYAVQCS